MYKRDQPKIPTRLHRPNHSTFRHTSTPASGPPWTTSHHVVLGIRRFPRVNHSIHARMDGGLRHRRHSIGQGRQDSGAVGMQQPARQNSPTPRRGPGQAHRRRAGPRHERSDVTTYPCWDHADCNEDGKGDAGDAGSFIEEALALLDAITARHKIIGLLYEDVPSITASLSTGVSQTCCAP